MYQRVTEHDFIEAFRRLDRLDTPDSDGGNFTYGGLKALFEYCEEYEESVCGDSGLELDVIGLCCDFAEYDDIYDLASEYTDDKERAEIVTDATNADDEREQLLDWFRDQTTTIEIPGTDRIIIQRF